MSKYKLTDVDYLNLWLLLTPEKINERFPEQSCSPRTIYRIYQRYGLSHIKESKQELIEIILWKRPIFITDEEAKTFIDESFELELERICRNIEEKIRKADALCQN